MSVWAFEATAQLPPGARRRPAAWRTPAKLASTSTLLNGGTILDLGKSRWGPDRLTLAGRMWLSIDLPSGTRPAELHDAARAVETLMRWTISSVFDYPTASSRVPLDGMRVYLRNVKQ